MGGGVIINNNNTVTVFVSWPTESKVFHFLAAETTTAVFYLEPI